MSDKSKMSTKLPLFHMQVPLTKAYRATSNPKPNKIPISENKEEKRREEKRREEKRREEKRREEKRREHPIQGRGRKQKVIKE